MNFEKTTLKGEIAHQLSALGANDRLPHAIIIAGGKEETREEIVNFLCRFAVCSSQEKPCCSCSNCIKANTRTHPDITYVQGSQSTKTKIYNKKIIDDIIRTSAIIPNEANTRVYVFKDADEKLPVISQNALLKTLEEPVQNTLFILTCKNPKALLETIISRCTVINIPLNEIYEEKFLELAEEIASSIFDINEYSLLKAASKINTRDTALSVLPPLKMIFRDAFILGAGAGKTLAGSEVSKDLKRKLTRGKTLALIETTDRAQQMVYSNVNLNLLSTWLCTELRRISWQK